MKGVWLAICVDFRYFAEPTFSEHARLYLSASHNAFSAYTYISSPFRHSYHRNKRKRSLEGTIPDVHTDGAADNDDQEGRPASLSRRAGAPRSRKVKAKKHTELKNFYRFQIKEEKMRDLESLRKKFAEDKERVAKMKEQRKFKPF